MIWEVGGEIRRLLASIETPAASDVPLGYADFGKQNCATYQPTVIHPLSELRTICSNKVLKAAIKLGGLGRTVEIDESKFGAKRKYKKGRVSKGPWVFRVVEQGPQKVLLFHVPDRTGATFVRRLITTHIRLGTVMYLDQFTKHSSSCWKTSLNSFHCSKTAIKNGSFRSHHI